MEEHEHNNEGCNHSHCNESTNNHEGNDNCICGHDHSNPGHSRTLGKLWIAITGGLFIVNSFILQFFFPMQTFSAEFSALLGAIVLAIPIITEACKNLYQGKMYMNELVAIAILAAFTNGDFQSAGVIAFFLLITIIIETKTASGAQKSIESLIKLTPDVANKLTENNSETRIDVSELQINDIIRVRPGENFPIDGEILTGDTTVNQASITGESFPVDKFVNDEVFAGTQNLTGSIQVKVTKLGENTTLGKVKDMILNAENTKNSVVRIIDKYAGYYTPVILMLAGVVWVATEDINRVITLFVVSCPCAVVLATPSAMIAAIAAAARLGILIKKAGDLELASKIKTFIFDKTGTLTEGVLNVAKLSPVEGVDPAELLFVAASIEQHSNHPTAKALQIVAKSAEITLSETSEFKEIHGKGVEGVLDGTKCCIGRQKWIQSIGITIDNAETENEEVSSMSIIYVAKDNKILGWIGFSDKIREESNAMIIDLKKSGVKLCAMVTGDRKSVADKVAAILNVDEIKSECLPSDKVEFVESAKKQSLVAFVGDGVNDAPALAAGDLSIAMGALGSDIAINSASIALMTNNLNRIPLLVSLSQKTRSIINQNLALGLIFVVCGIILSIFNYMTPINGAILHSLSTVIVLFNSARLVRIGEEYT